MGSVHAAMYTIRAIFCGPPRAPKIDQANFQINPVINTLVIRLLPWPGANTGQYWMPVHRLVYETQSDTRTLIERAIIAGGHQGAVDKVVGGISAVTNPATTRGCSFLNYIPGVFIM